MINLPSSSSVKLSTQLFICLLIISTITSLITVTMANPSSQFFLNGRYGRRSLPPDSSENQFPDKETIIMETALKYNLHPNCYNKGLIGVLKCIVERHPKTEDN
ncbi:uncharacterized protein LOC128389198 [Panonychus citri]|uniref:uncharacterized protein LOC128389198 n=1 Tax=Panonychus citri TaxID=50023 RepID=UPI002307E9E7|nr:uncharacterized protein LOC128389198 [Panonychus citri]